jgi:glycerate 2-kinase
VSSPAETLLRSAFARALRDFDVAGRVRLALRGVDASRVLAIGKTAPAMLAGAFRERQEALLVVPDGIAIGWSAPSTRIMIADHPLPTERSVAAAEAALAFVARGDVVALVSGGASALLALPAEGIDLEKKRSIGEALLRAGVPVREINVVRRHLSRVKGGQLGAACPGRALTLIASDVLSGGPEDIGSGPTVADPTTVADARAVLSRVGLEAPLVETIKPADPRAQRLEHRFVASPEDFVVTMRIVLEAEGLTVFDLPPTEDDVESLAHSYAGLGASLLRGQALVRAAEPTVIVPPAHERGGRSSHLAALAAPLLPEGVALLCGATDGVDGSSGGAGAVVTRGSFDAGAAAAAARAFDTGKLHERAGTMLESAGPSGLNLCDVHVLVRL